MIVAWGDCTYLRCNIPAPNSDFVAIGAGYQHGLGIRSDGSVAGWGANRQGELNVPPPNAGFGTVTGGVYYSLGLKGVACDPSDVNCDGSVDAFDVEPFVELLLNPNRPCSTCAGDVNGDGVIGAFDIEPFVEQLLTP